MNYEKYYFAEHPRAKKKPIANPYHESINTWMILPRMQMNALKQKWKDFLIWYVHDIGFDSKNIQECEIAFCTYYKTNMRHDIDNSVPKFMLDGLVCGGLVADDDMKHIKKLTLECAVDKQRPRTEITIIYEDERMECNEEGCNEKD